MVPMATKAHSGACVDIAVFLPDEKKSLALAKAAGEDAPVLPE